MTNQLATQESQLSLPPMRVEEVLQHHALIAEVLEKIMKPDVHYGVIPGTSKPTLYQAGAELISVTFRLVPTFTYELRELPSLHREYIFVVNMSTPRGELVAQGFGSCSTMEEKYRWRIDATQSEPTGHGVPKAYWDIKDSKAKLEYLRRLVGDDRGNFGTAKIMDGKVLARSEKGGDWGVVRYPEKAAKVENDNIADVYNTVGKIAYKRAYVSASIKATAASDTFTQDVEDLVGKIIDLGGDENAHRVAPQEAAIHIRKDDVQDIRRDVANTIAENAAKDWENVRCPIGSAGGPVNDKTVGELCGPEQKESKCLRIFSWWHETGLPHIAQLIAGNVATKDHHAFKAAMECAENAFKSRPEPTSAVQTPETASKAADGHPESTAEPLATPPEPSLEVQAEVTKDPAPAKSAKKPAATMSDWRNVVVPFKCVLQGQKLGALQDSEDGATTHLQFMGAIRKQLLDNPAMFKSIPAKDANKFKAAYEIAVVEMCIGRSPQEINNKIRDLCSDLVISNETQVAHAEALGIIPKLGANVWEKHAPESIQNVIRMWPDFAQSVQDTFSKEGK